MAAGQRPYDSYKTRVEDESVHVEVDRASRGVNKQLVRCWSTTRDQRVLDVFAYVHGHRESVPMDSWLFVFQHIDGLVAVDNSIDSCVRMVYRGIGDDADAQLQHQLSLLSDPVLVLQEEL